MSINIRAFPAYAMGKTTKYLEQDSSQRFRNTRACGGALQAASRQNHVADYEVLTPGSLISVRGVLTFFDSLWSKSVERTRRIIQRATLIGEAGLSMEAAQLTDFLTGRQTHIAAWQNWGHERRPEAGECWKAKIKWAGNQEAVTFLGYRPTRS